MSRLSRVALAAWLIASGLAGAAEQADLRSWKTGGTSVEGRFLRLQDNKVILETRGGAPQAFNKASLSVEDQEYLAGLSATNTLEWLSADWSGMSAAEHVRHHSIQIVRSEAGVTAQGTWYQAIPREKALKMQTAAGGKTASPAYAVVVRESYEVTTDGDLVTLKSLRPKCLLGPPDIARSCPVTVFSGRFEKPGILIGTWNDTSGGKGRFWWARDDAFYKPFGGAIEAGATTQLTSLDGTSRRYACYVPKLFNPAVATPVLINDSPAGNAAPLSTEAADAVNWIMAGLTDVHDGIGDRQEAEYTAATIFDMQRRFNVDRKRFYFSGMAAGGRRAASRSIFFPDSCAGLICIAAGFAFTKQGSYDYPPLDKPTVFIIGETDMFSGSEVIHRTFPGEEARGRVTKLLKHPGGDEWGPPELHVEAVRWLDALRGSRKLGVSKTAPPTAPPPKSPPAPVLKKKAKP